MSLVSELTTIKEDISDGVVANKVSRFAYKQQAYDDNEADGTDNYNVNQDNNIPLGTPTVMKVNQSVIELGWRARASSITRMLMNHFLGRVSYNLNKANDMINSILDNLVTYLGTADGIATLDSNGHLIQQSPVGSPYVPMTKGFLGAVFGWLLGNAWELIEGTDGANGFYYSSRITYANGLWVIGANKSGGGTERQGCWWSENGRTWTQGTGDNTSINMLTPVYANGLWVAEGSSSPWWSEDGKAWVQGTLLTEVASVTFSQIPVYANGLWVTGSNKGNWWSEDGKSWTQGSLTTVSTRQINYVNGMWHSNSTWGDIHWSEDGKNWTHCTGIPMDTIPNSATVLINGLWLVGTYNEGSGGQISQEQGIYWSEDGKAWTQGTGGKNRAMAQPKYANGVLVSYSVDSRGEIYWSEDGKTWTQAVVYSSERINGLDYFNGVWVVVASGGCRWSNDGKNWTQGYLDGTIFSTSCVSLSRFNGMWFITTSIGLAKSLDGKVWSMYSPSLYNMCYANGILLGFYYKTPSQGLYVSDIEVLEDAGLVDLGANVPIVLS